MKCVCLCLHQGAKAAGLVNSVNVMVGLDEELVGTNSERPQRNMKSVTLAAS